MRKNKLYNNPQDQNGFQGETRSKAILSKRFRIYEPSSDVSGIDLMTEIIHTTDYEYKYDKKNIKEFGLVQCKYFEKGTTLRIDAKYIEDEDGAIPNFFVLIHTTDEYGCNHWYFFTAEEIKSKFPLKKDKNRSLYYSFSVTKKITYADHFDIPDGIINDRIYEAIKKTAEFRLQSIINNVNNQWIKPTKRINNYDEEFKRSISELHIVDKLLKATQFYKEFQHILAWRLVDKMSYSDKLTEQTFYNNFTLKTTNREIDAFFNSINITDKIEIRNRQFFKGVNNPEKKIQEIIKRLNDSLIYFFKGRDHKKISIKIPNKAECNCLKCQYENLNFIGAYDNANGNILKSDNTYDLLACANLFFQLHIYGKAKHLLERIINNSKSTETNVPRYFALYNLEIAERYGISERTVDLYYELLKLPLQEEKKQILKSIGDRSLLNSFKGIIDELYIRVKDYKNRRENTSTGPSIDKLYSKVFELYYFYRENHCFITNEFETLFEKFIECCCISYSLQTPFRSHVISFTELEITIMLLYCRPEKILQFIQRNNIREINCTEEGLNHFFSSLENFFAEKNLSFLHTQIKYTDNRTKNPDLRHKTINIFNNLCYLMTYLQFELQPKHMNMLINFVKKTDLSAYDISSISFVVLQKSAKISNETLMELLKATLLQNDDVSYLPTNIISTLADRSYILKDENLLNELSNMALKSQNNLLPVLWKTLTPKRQIVFQKHIVNTLEIDFNPDLYTEVLFNNILDHPLQFVLPYSQTITKQLNKTRHEIFDSKSTISGLSHHLHKAIENFAIVCQKLGVSNFDSEVVQCVKNLHPYFDFIITIEQYKKGDPFELIWLTNDPQNRKIQLFKQFDNVSDAIKTSVKNCDDKVILKKFAYYFS